MGADGGNDQQLVQVALPFKRDDLAIWLTEGGCLWGPEGDDDAAEL